MPPEPNALRGRSGHALGVLLALLTCACAPTSAALPVAVDPTLVSAASTAQHRLLVFRVCEGGRCSSDAYLQWFHEFPPETLHTSPVPELSEGGVVTSARWVRNKSRPGLIVVVAPQREDLDPVTLFVVPGKPGRYEIHR